MLSSSTLDDLIRQQESLRLQSVRYLEELRIRQNTYRSSHCSKLRPSTNKSGIGWSAGSATAQLNEHVVHSSKTLEDSHQRCYRPVSTVSKSSVQEFGSIPTSTDVSTAPQFSQQSADDRTHINARPSASAILCDDLNSEKWSMSATRDARKKLISGRTQMQTNLNNFSSVDVCNGGRVLEPASSFTARNGCKALELNADTNGYFSSGDGDIGRLDYNVTPQKSEQSLEGTPKSILRHRQIIDKNVHVESKFDHTPTDIRSRKHRRGLNFSYSDVDDAQLFGRRTKSVNFDVDSRKSTPQTNAEDINPSSRPTTSQVTSLKSSSFAGDSNTLPSSQRFYRTPSADDSIETSVPVDAAESSTARKAASDGLLLQTGNDRQNAKIVRELESRNRSGLFSTDQPVVTNAPSNASQSQVLHICSVVFGAQFLARDSMLSALYAIARPYVRLSHGWISQKRLNVSSKFFHHLIGPTF